MPLGKPVNVFSGYTTMSLHQKSRRIEGFRDFRSPTIAESEQNKVIHLIL